MKALLYLGLIALILWAGLTWEEAQAPAPVVETPVENEVDVEVNKPLQTSTEIEIVSQTAPAVAAPTSIELAEPPPPQITYDEAYVEALERAIHNRVNDERVLQKLNTLSYNDLLAEVAAFHSTDMAKNDYFEHEDQDGCDSACRATAAGYKWRMVGENLFLLKREYHFSADGASAVVVAGWMGSEGHRENLFEEDFTEEGIGVVIKGDALYVTQMLGRPR